MAARGRRIGQVGLGLRLAAGRRQEVVLAAVTTDGPASRAGLRLNDQVLAIDGQPVSARDLATAAALLEGPAGTQVVLRLKRGRRHFDIRLLRMLLPPDTVHAERRDDILWLQLDNFSNATDRHLMEALAAGFRPSRPRGVVLDLRGNRGGLLGQAVAVAGAFLPGGVVAQTAGRHPDSARIYLASANDLAAGLPVVVLVDGRSASAAEVVAAALGDRGRAVVVGSATTGKGLIQVVVPLPNGGELLVTWSRLLAPRGWPLQGLGVLPALCTSLGGEATAAGLARLRLGDPPMAVPLARQRSARAPVPASEVAALRDSCPPAEGRPADAAMAQALISDPGAYAAALALLSLFNSYAIFGVAAPWSGAIGVRHAPSPDISSRPRSPSSGDRRPWLRGDGRRGGPGDGAARRPVRFGPAHQVPWTAAAPEVRVLGGDALRLGDRVLRLAGLSGSRPRPGHLPGQWRPAGRLRGRRGSGPGQAGAGPGYRMPCAWP